MKRMFLMFLLGVLTCSVHAQTMFTTPRSGTVRVRDIEDKYNVQVYSLEAPEPDGEEAQEGLREQKAAVLQRFPRRRAEANTGSNKTASAPQPLIIRGFIPDSSASIPPDNYLAVSNAGIGMNVHNSMLSVVNAKTGMIIKRVSLYDFTLAVGLGVKPSGGNYYRYDPKVMYDPDADRFFFVCLAGVNNYSHIIVGFSQSNDPLGTWNFYSFAGDYAADGTWFDYPTIAMTRHEVFVTGNKLVYNGSFQTGFVRSVIYQIRKSDGYSGQSLNAQIWDQVNYKGRPVRNIFPVNGGNNLHGPSQYFLSNRNMDTLNDSVFLLQVMDTIGAPGNQVSVTALKSNLSYGFPPNGRQPDSFYQLQTNDGRILGAMAVGSELQFVSTSVYPATGASSIYHGIISNYNGASPSVRAAFITADSLDFGYPNISFTNLRTGSVSSIISFDYSGPTQYPGVAALYWNGTNYSDLLYVKTGDSSIKMLQDSVQRWGDYTGSQPRWDSDGEVWIVGLFGHRDNSYCDWMCLLRSPDNMGVPQEPTSSPAAILYPNPSYKLIKLRFNLKEKANIQFSICNTAGAQLEELYRDNCLKGESEIEFNIASLPAGQYFLRGVDNNGFTLFAKSFVKQ
ncbi:MAG: T9SS type A sorting domain-containing protein [Bacteroidetes bacterium]|nr:T9SS type A sorting domain-containing protein [Bacteroidota bacterium]